LQARLVLDGSHRARAAHHMDVGQARGDP
jgi:hypothetical protein